ncbi:MAG TPA: diadenylate cyclase, partial [bacterium]|nr:diadenylate cyclase [bacterium]
QQAKPSKRGKQIDPAKLKKQQIKAQNQAILKAVQNIMCKTKTTKLFIYIDALDESYLPEKFPPHVQVILVTKNHEYNYSGPATIKGVLPIPKLKLGRMGLIKIAVILGLSAKLVDTDDRIVFLLGKTGNEMLDTFMCFQIDEESELLTGHGLSDIPKTIVPAVFESTLSLAIELGNQGKEGKPVGTIFVLGDEDRVMQLSRQMIINPFKGYEPEERNILNPTLKETVRELSSVDGAIVIAGNGEIISAGRYLGASTDNAEIPRGLGSRHLAAAGITALTNAIAIVISESSGDVRIFKNGKIIMAIEKPIHK